MKIVSWNVNGLRAVEKKCFRESFKLLDADMVMIQETKLKAGQIDLEFPGYESFWNYADRPGYSGTAIYSRIKPLSVSYGLGIDEFDHEGRVITLELEDMFVVCVYVPNSQDGLRRLDYRQNWDKAFREYLGRLADIKPVTVGGDFNVAHNEIDLKNPSTNHFNPGFTDEERSDFSQLLDWGFIDSWREMHPQEIKYSWWSYRMAARERNVGWRIDYLLCSEALRSRMVESGIRNDIYGSDHCPVELVLSRQ
ncbi:MAG: exodeoxyribonuclease III [Bacteroidales bacterium]|nr:exodeoxyribonuclease III [Bacteroidales bacterium]